LGIAVIVALSLSACEGSTGTAVDGGIELPKIDRHPQPSPFANRGPLAAMPTYDPASLEPNAVDLRGFDLSALDLCISQVALAQATFDDRTVWPPAEQMPPDFNRQAIMEFGKNPGLRIRSLHEQGITGRGVGIAIVDSALLVEHQEYRDRLGLYEEIGPLPANIAHMHGTGVTAIAVGQSVGVAPDADLYYIGSTNIDEDTSGGTSKRNWTDYAWAARRILAINAGLPASQRIRVLAMQVNWKSTQKGYAEIMAAVADARTTASPNGNNEYTFHRQGGWSWAIPFIAGVYALACQVDPTMTPERFWALAMQTGRTIQVTHEGQSYSLGPIIDPAAFLAVP
jgi:subtilisin family serine protease